MTDNKTLIANIVRRITDATVYWEQTQQKGISTRAKSAHFRAGIMVSATVVEALVFLLIRGKTRHLDPIIRTVTFQKPVYNFKTSDPLFGGMVICRKEKEDVTLLGRKSTFQFMNQYCLEEGLITQKEFGRLEKTRDIRAGFHVFTLAGKDRGYTAPLFREMQEQISFLIDKINLHSKLKP